MRIAAARDAGATPPALAHTCIPLLTLQIGRRQAEENYRPLQPAGQPPLRVAPAAEHSRGSSIVTASQIATTQMGGAAMQSQQRQSLVLPAPPAAGAATRRPTLRERMRATQALRAPGATGAAAGPLAASAASGWLGVQAPQAAAPPNDENEGSNSQPAADLLQLGGKPALASSAQPAAQQRQQPSALDDVMADLDAGLKAQQAQAATQQQHQQADQGQAAVQQGGSGQQSGQVTGSTPRPSSLFEELFGPDPTGSAAARAAGAGAAAAAPPLLPAPAQATAVADAPAVEVQRAALGGQAAPPPAGPQAAQQQPGGRSSGRAQRTSSRLRPPAQQQQQPAQAPHAAADAVPMEAAGRPAAPLPLADVPATEAAAAGSEPREDVACALDMCALHRAAPGEAPVPLLWRPWHAPLASAVVCPC